ncbi:hypothetical protein RchiOBHm_Chr2g0132191 [Rosa chinensis]|uniref:Uncharacterized protein n=1 Tax=Rosa chinensis TaxID=74649 RepID=A0A2P6RV93_ROSCH|nr:hypothetical protein RchiOBHm_Chr2g0132191 [Rosa chinensis]
MECWNLEPWLENKGLGDANQVLAYFAVSKLGEPPVDGIINTNPEGRTASYGKWASAVADRLHAGGLTCKVLGKEAFQKQMLEKLIWISAFMLVGARHPGATVGGVEKDTALRFPASLQSLPLQQLLRSDWYLKEPWRIDYVRTHELLPTFLLQSKRNGWFYSLSERAIAEGKPDPCPLHTAWLKELKVVKKKTRLQRMNDLDLSVGDMRS